MKRSNLTASFLLLLIALVAFAMPAYSQAPKTKATPMLSKAADAPQVVELDSKSLARKVNYVVILPADYYTDRSKRYPVVYLLHGLTGHYSDWNSKTKLFDYSRAYNFIIVMPEGNDGWYTDSATVPNDKYETYIVGDLIPTIDKDYRTLADRGNRYIAGLSMGGYGSIKFGLKYPAMFSLVGSFSGALRAAEWNNKNSAEWVYKSIMSVYGEDGSETRKSNDIYRLLQDFPADRLGELPYIYMDCGTEDRLIDLNNDFAKILRDRKIPHEFRELPGKHEWPYWDAQVQEFLQVVKRRTVNTMVKTTSVR